MKQKFCVNQVQNLGNGLKLGVSLQGYLTQD